MKPLRIDFSPPSIARGILRTGPRTWLIVAAGLALNIAAVISADRLLGAHAAAEAELQTIRAALAQRAARIPQPKRVAISDTQANALNNAIAQLNLPWRDLLNAVEAGTPATIALLGIDPDARKHVVRGIAEAETSEGMIAYIEQLKRQPFFRDVLLTRHEINEQDPNRPLRFQFEAHWVETAP